MKALRLTESQKPLTLQEIPVPATGSTEVLVKIKAAGICHSDVHYRAGLSSIAPLPLTLGHEISGIVEKVGPQVTGFQCGDRVCLHYMVTCGNCYYCTSGSEQFCVEGKMLGKDLDGGYAEFIALPARGVVILPDEISFEHGAALMCSSATSFHALRKARLKPGEKVAVFGVGGLGMSAIQLSRAFGACDVYAVDIDEGKLKLAETFGATPVDGTKSDPVAEIQHLTGGRGVDVALELIGLSLTMKQAVQSLAIFGRAVVVGLSKQPFEVDSYRELLCKEVEVLGCSDHLLQELPLLLDFTRRGLLDLSNVVTRRIPLQAGAVNEAMDALEEFKGVARSVITP